MIGVRIIRHLSYSYHTFDKSRSFPLAFSPSATTGVNTAAATLVERVLVDDILWYQSLIQVEQELEEGIGENTISRKIKSKFDKVTYMLLQLIIHLCVRRVRSTLLLNLSLPHTGSKQLNARGLLQVYHTLDSLTIQLDVVVGQLL